MKAIKDKNGTILSVGNKVLDAKGAKWKIDNIGGVTFMVQPVTGDIKKTIILRKFDFTTCEKVA